VQGYTPTREFYHSNKFSNNRDTIWPLPYSISFLTPKARKRKVNPVPKHHHMNASIMLGGKDPLVLDLDARLG